MIFLGVGGRNTARVRRVRWKRQEVDFKMPKIIGDFRIGFYLRESGTLGSIDRREVKM